MVGLVPTTLPREARRLREDLAELTGLAANDLGIVWRDLRTAEAAKAALRDVVPQLVEVYGTAAGSLAADWYDDLRDARGVGRRFRAIVPPVPDPGAASLAGYAVGPLYQADPDWVSAQTLAEGGVQRRIANVARATITGSSVQDPSAKGWRRVGVGECKFCQMLLGRGAVYSESTADFQAHDHCGCSGMPEF